MTSSHTDKEKILADLKDNSLEVEQHEHKKKILRVFQELKNRAEFGETAASQKEINVIENQLKELRVKKALLQQTLECDHICNTNDSINQEAAIMTSSHTYKEKILAELKDISLEVDQLEHKKKILRVFQELRNRAEFGETEETAASQKEINVNENQPKELRVKKAELQQNCDPLCNTNDPITKEDITDTCKRDLDTGDSEHKVVFVEPPPSFPAPSVILDSKNLPTHPTRTQCPECSQFVTTETFSSVTSVTWLICCITAMIGCVAGCCLLPFCMKRFKATTHKCPKCRTKITTVKKL